MTQEDKIPPAGLHPRLVKKLLDNLEGNDAFRAQFQASPEQALRSIGYTDPWACMQVTSGKLASPEQIKAQPHGRHPEPELRPGRPGRLLTALSIRKGPAGNCRAFPFQRVPAASACCPCRRASRDTAVLKKRSRSVVVLSA